MKKISLLLLLGLFFTLIASPLSSFAAFPESSKSLSGWTSTTPEPPPPEAILAIEQAIGAHKETVLPLLVYNTQLEDIRASRDGSWVTTLLNPVDPDSGQIIPAEPGLAVARLTDSGWEVYLPSDPGWSEAIRQAPLDLLSATAKAYWLELEQQYTQNLPAQPLDGYLLPWLGGTTMYMTQSVHHDAYTPSGSAHFAFDFAKPGYPSGMFDVYAAKAGKVKRFVDSWPNGHYNPNNPNEANYIVLEDTTTSPTTYQLYLHLAQNSIPEELKVVGTPVRQGQFIGVADDTGVSSGNHLHFHVHDAWFSYWGTSLDITFDDVTINGGRPRNQEDLAYCLPSDVCQTTSETYISANFPNGDGFPPTGGLSAPANWINVSSRSVRVEGWGQDSESGLDHAQAIANFNGSWQRIGPQFTYSPFSFDWDMCALNVPDGPISIALELTDQAGNQAPGLPGLRHLTKDFLCPVEPPTCQPGANQAALYTDVDFTGSCLVLGIGSYPNSLSLGNLGADAAASIQVGENVVATLFANPDFQARGETFLSNDSSLADNLIGANQVSSLTVQARSLPPVSPSALFPSPAEQFYADKLPGFSWDNNGGADQFQVQLTLLGTSTIYTSPWLPARSWRPDILPAGDYTWQVRASGPGGISAWSDPRALTINTSPALPQAVPAPWSDSMESGTNGWITTGLWSLQSLKNHTPGGASSWHFGGTSYQTGEPVAGTLTTRPIQLPPAAQALRFWYTYNTENSGIHWDQRMVQISKNGGSFQELYHLSDDPANTWLQSPVIDLSSYAGQNVRLRFSFQSLDSLFNHYSGWAIDDVTISALPSQSCSDADNLPASATPINYNQPAQGVICPSGDIDFYSFSGMIGEQLGLSVQATNSNLDPTVTLLDGDGISVLSENDDRNPGVNRDSLTAYRLRHSGTYFVKVKAWNHPSAGGPDLGYTLTVYQDNSKPQASPLDPPTNAFLNSAPISITLTATDSAPGISRVEFIWHSQDWESPAWQSLPPDWDSTDGWGATFNPGILPEGIGIALFARVIDWAGNLENTVSWNVGIDRTAPTASVIPFPAAQDSSVIQVDWMGSDALSGVQSFDLQKKQDSNAWKDYASYPGAGAHRDWIVVEPGHNYSFRIRATDNAGNRPTYPATGQATNVPPAATLCSAPDSWENDNSDTVAQAVSEFFTFQVHNFCNPASADRYDDQDWLKIPVSPARLLLIDVDPQNPKTAVYLELFSAPGIAGSLLAQTASVAYGLPAHLAYQPLQDGYVYLRIRHINGRAIGNSVSYKVRIRQGLALFLPMVR